MRFKNNWVAREDIVMICKKKIGLLVFVFTLAIGFFNAEAGMRARSTQLSKPLSQKSLLSQKQIAKNISGQAGECENKGLWENIKENGLVQGLSLWWNCSRAVKSNKNEQARRLLEKDATARRVMGEIEQELEGETDPSKIAWLKGRLQALKQFIIDNKIALGALGIFAVSAAAYLAHATGEKPAEKFDRQEPVLEGAGLKPVEEAPMVENESFEPSKLSEPVKLGRRTTTFFGLKVPTIGSMLRIDQGKARQVRDVSFGPSAAMALQQAKAEKKQREASMLDQAKRDLGRQAEQQVQDLGVAWQAEQAEQAELQWQEQERLQRESEARESQEAELERRQAKEQQAEQQRQWEIEAAQRAEQRAEELWQRQERAEKQREFEAWAKQQAESQHRRAEEHRLRDQQAESQQRQVEEQRLRDQEVARRRAEQEWMRQRDEKLEQEAEEWGRQQEEKRQREVEEWQEQHQELGGERDREFEAWMRQLDEKLEQEVKELLGQRDDRRQRELEEWRKQWAEANT